MIAKLVPMLAAASVTALALGGVASAKVVGFKIVETVSPAFEGAQFEGTGPYERVDAIAEFAIDPRSERGRSIVDLDKAPVDEAGLVRFSTEVTILRPTDPAKGSGVLFYDVPNRGRNLAFMLMNLGSSADLPETAEDAGDGYLMREGYTIVWSGWQFDAPDNLLNISLPVLPEVTGLSREEFVFDKAETVSVAKLTYPAADLDPERATLSVRRTPEDPRSTAPGLSFQYLSATEIEITRPEGMDAGAIYEFTYPAKDAVPAGLAFAATSDLISYLRGNPGHDAEPVLSGIEHTLGLGISQSGRFLRDFIYQGFNTDEEGARVFDGAIPHIAGSRKTFTNYRFAQPGRYSRQHEDHDFPGDQFPFSYAETTDPLSGGSGSILTACSLSDTCPKIMHTDTSTEFWQARAALVSTSATGEALTMPDNVRLYYLSGLPHFTGWQSSSSESPLCRFPTNPISSAPVMRALLSSIRDWVVDGKTPPDSRYPSVADGTLVPLQDLNLPAFGTDTYMPVYNVLQVRDHAELPPADGGSYPVLVPQLDNDGIPSGGIKDPAVAAPLGTYWGWNLRNEGFAGGNLCGLTGSFVAFPASGDHAGDDSRKPLSGRYTDADAFLSALSAAADELVAAGYLRAEDAGMVMERGRTMYPSD
ncbi:alpha/beta hydrolase domain-containing protein [Roseibium salinum]|uniref:Alpha/beta hydrolase domain-containing protein n=1 Tax=Roseibium salinum TaxID=1604349 RepID=A0ABT3R465_9HYPH|nr:alpha/beta hydrolase domain-containing protein [Roseibium sp. DSM 29163]MCX2723979.1 alpha/beta hydrolase domain-containing protein [Roseibium sp. DSM 29163]MDN3718203.1 alpha/beta hydrolase domain-containing protein [Roseibium salinum]